MGWLADVCKQFKLTQTIFVHGQAWPCEYNVFYIYFQFALTHHAGTSKHFGRSHIFQHSHNRTNKVVAAKLLLNKKTLWKKGG